MIQNRIYWFEIDLSFPWFIFAVMKKAILLLLLIIGFGTQLFAQNYVDIAKMNYGFMPNVPFGDTDNSTDIHDIDLGLVYPIKLSDKLAIITGVDYSDQIMNITPYNDVRLYSSGIRLGASIQHSDKWSGLYVAIPKVAGDYQNISSNDFQIGGVAVWKYTKSEYLKYKLGIYASTERFGLITIPIIGGYYLSPNKKFEANLSLPIAFDINYKVAKPLRFGVDFNAIVRSYDLTSNALSQYYVHRWVKELGLYAQFDLLNESLIIKTRLLYAMNDFGMYNDGDKITIAVPATEIGDNRERWNKELGSVLGFKASLIYRFQLNQSANKSPETGDQN
jgi:hypothetical protein